MPTRRRGWSVCSGPGPSERLAALVRPTLTPRSAGRIAPAPRPQYHRRRTLRRPDGRSGRRISPIIKPEQAARALFLRCPDSRSLLRLAPWNEACACRPQRDARLPARRGGGDQPRRRHRAPAGQGPRPGRDRLAQGAGQALGRRARRGRPRRLRPRRPRHAGAAVPLGRRARASRRGREGQGAVHVDHEHAAAALPAACPRRFGGRPQGRLHRSDRLAELRSGLHDAVQPGPAGRSGRRRSRSTSSR